MLKLTVCSFQGCNLIVCVPKM